MCVGAFHRSNTLSILLKVRPYSPLPLLPLISFSCCCCQYHLKWLMVAADSLHQFPTDCPCLIGVKAEGKQQNDLHIIYGDIVCSQSPVLAYTSFQTGNVLVECAQQGLVLTAEALIGIAHHLCSDECLTV